MYNCKITYLHSQSIFRITETQKLLSIIDCISYIKELNEKDNIKILKIEIIKEE